MMKKYKIVLFNDSLVGGAGKSILVLAEALEREGIEVHIVIYENNVDFNVPKNIHLHLLQNLNPKNSDARTKTVINRYLSLVPKYDHTKTNKPKIKANCPVRPPLMKRFTVAESRNIASKIRNGNEILLFSICPISRNIVTTRNIL